MNTFHPVTLNQHLGTLTAVGVVTLSQRELTPRCRFLRSTTLRYLELDSRPNPFGP